MPSRSPREPDRVADGAPLTGEPAARTRAPARWLARRFPQWRFGIVALALAATTGAVAVAAVQTHLAWRRQWDAAEREVRRYTVYAARLVGDEVVRAGLEQRMRLLAPVMSVPAADGAAMSLAAFAATAERQLAGDVLAADSLRGYFRLDLASGQFEARALAPELVATLRDSLDRRLPRLERGNEPALLNLLVGGEPVSVMYARQFDERDRPVAVLGMAVSRRLNVARNVAAILGTVPLLPPAFAGGEWDMESAVRPRPGALGPDAPAASGLVRTPPGRRPSPADTLLALRIEDHTGTLLYESPRQFDSPYRGRYAFRTRPGGFVVHAALRPDVAERLTSVPRPTTERWLLLSAVLLAGSAAVVGLAQLRREQELVRVRREFLSSVSHELRTPLAQIRMFSEMLLLGRTTSDEQRGRFLGIIGREARRLSGLVENILLFSRAEGERLQLAREWTDVSALVAGVAAGFEPFAEQRRSGIEADVAPGIEADVDPGALRQVVTNLLDNALKYGPEGQRVRLTLDCDAIGRVVLAVEDEGPGIPPGDRERVWKPFERLTTTGGTAGGSGLGLAVVRELVRQHGGWSRVEAAAGGGARLVVALPRGARPTPAIGRTGEYRIPATRGRTGEYPTSVAVATPSGATPAAPLDSARGRS